MNRNELALAEAVTVVLDDTVSTDNLSIIRNLGRGWALGIDAWQTSTYPYLILCAANRTRIVQHAPLILLAVDVRQAAEIACEKLDDVKCAWMFLCSEATQDVVQAIVLADTKTEGTA